MVCGLTPGLQELIRKGQRKRIKTKYFFFIAILERKRGHAKYNMTLFLKKSFHGYISNR
jgi:hypothetical protein